MELNEQTNSWIDEQSYKDEFERVEQFKKRNEFINMKILWLSGNLIIKIRLFFYPSNFFQIFFLRFITPTLIFYQFHNFLKIPH